MIFRLPLFAWVQSERSSSQLAPAGLLRLNSVSNSLKLPESTIALYPYDLAEAKKIKSHNHDHNHFWQTNAIFH